MFMNVTFHLSFQLKNELTFKVVMHSISAKLVWHTYIFSFTILRKNLEFSRRLSECIQYLIENLALCLGFYQPILALHGQKTQPVKCSWATTITKTLEDQKQNLPALAQQRICTSLLYSKTGMHELSDHVF